MVQQSLPSQHLEDLKTICDESGIKLTHQRLEIFSEMMLSSDHPSAEIIYDRFKKRIPTIAIDTVYRTLGTFNALGVINNCT